MVVIAAPRPEYPPDPAALALAASVLGSLRELPDALAGIAAGHRGSRRRT
jgi:hypothetical protein